MLDDFDIIYYNATIKPQNFIKLYEIIAQPKSDKLLLVLSTLGGNPHSAFKTARYLQQTYKEVNILINGACKSAGTLITVGSDIIIMDDVSELGPLDVQLIQKDEINKPNSGLDTFEALSQIEELVQNHFINYFCLLSQQGLTIKTSAKIATDIAIGSVEPILNQINPIKIGEVKRATKIAVEYGKLLIEDKRGNIAIGQLIQLVVRYPSHSFVIDFKEAKKLFKKVQKINKEEEKVLLFCQNNLPQGKDIILRLNKEEIK